MEGSPGPCFNPEDAGGAGDRNSWQAAGEGQLAPSHPHIRGGFLKLEAVNAEEELDHTRCPAATRRSAFFWFSSYLIAILMRQGKQESWSAPASSGIMVTGVVLMEASASIRCLVV